MITNLHHAQITIPPEAEAAGRAFYCGVLGLPEIPKPETLRDRGGFWLQVGEQALHVGVEEGVTRAATKAHLAYQVTDLAIWRTRLQAQGIELLDGIPIPGYERFELRDPFGNRVELIQQITG